MDDDAGLPEDPEGSSLGDLISDLDLADTFGDEVPILGRLKRLYRIVKKAVAREYIQEVQNMKIREEKLISALQEQTELVRHFRRYANTLEKEIKDLKAALDERGG